MVAKQKHQMRTPSEIVSGNPWIEVVGLNQGTTARWPKVTPNPGIWNQLVEAVRERGGRVPNAPGFYFGIALSTGAAVIWILRDGAAIFTCGLCWREEGSDETWDFLVGLRQDILGGSAGWLGRLRSQQPESIPWIAEMSRTREPAANIVEALSLARFLCMLLPLLEYLEA